MAKHTKVPDPFYTLRGNDGALTCLKFLGTSEEFLFSGTENGEVKVWDMKVKRSTAKIGAHIKRSVIWLDFLAADKMLTQGRDGCVNFWTLNEREWTKTGSVKSCDLSFCPSALLCPRGGQKGTMLAVPGDASSTVNIYDVNERTLIGSLMPTGSGIDPIRGCGMCMAVKAWGSESHLLVGYEDGSVALWDVQARKMIGHNKIHQESLMCLDYDASSNTGVSGSVDNKLIRWTVSSDGCITETDSVEILNPGFSQCVLRGDKRVLAVSGWDRNVRLFSWKKLKALAILTYHKDNVQSLAYSVDNVLACGSKDMQISLWDLYRQ